MSDDLARTAIISNVNSNYFVEAGAGSGKTTMLVERMVAMVEQGFNVEKICTITFTKAAANEFYARFQKRLSERSKKEKNPGAYPGRLGVQTDITMKRCDDALQNIDSCFMGTIDAFCNMILSEHPLEAGIPASSTMIEEDDVVEKYVQEYMKIKTDNNYACLRGKYGNFVKTQSSPIDVFRKLVALVISIRDAEFVYDKHDNLSIKSKFGNDMQDIGILVEKLLSNKALAYEGNKDSVAAWDALEQRASQITASDWEDNFSNTIFALRSISKLRIKPVDNLDDYFGSSERRLNPHNTGKKLTWYDLEGEEFKGVVDKMQDYQARVALDFVIESVNVMAQVMKRNGNLTYFDYKLYLRDLLKKEASTGNHILIDHIYERHRYFMIDEFQDTDPMQAEIFFYLAADDFDEDWKKCRPKPGSLFIVGDPKQSIYRFKNADVASFMNVRSLFTGTSGEVVKLTSNFRSTHKLHEWFNDVFGNHLLSADTVDQSKYEPIENVVVDDCYTSGVYKFQVADKANDAQEVFDIVNTLVNNPDIRIEGGREIQYRDIMIISGKKDLLNRYTSVFTDNNIPFKVEGYIDFSECPALKDLIAIYKAAVRPDNNLLIYEALLSRVFNVSSETLMKIKDDLSRVRTEGLFTSEDPEAKKAIELLDRYHQKSKEVSASALLAELIDKLRIFEISGNYDQEYVYYVLELLRSKESTGEISSSEDAIIYLDKLMAGTEKLERCASLEKNDNRIHLANLHKVKGLEAPIVILAGSQKSQPNNPSKRVEYIDGKPKCYMFGLRQPSLKFSESAKKEEEKKSVEAERIRQLYVAATRAKRILVVADSTPWGVLSERISEDFFTSFAKKAFTKAASESVDALKPYDTFTSIINDESASRISSIDIHKPSDIEFDSIEEAYGTINTKRNPKLIGTLVHKMMEVIVSSGNRVDAETLIDDLCRAVDAQDHYYAEILHKVNKTIQNGGYPQNNGLQSDILQELLSADEVYCEVPFSSHNQQNSITTGIIDVLYRKGEDWFIIDYKTNADGNDLDKKYQSQLSEYEKAVESRTGKKVKASVYHVDV